MASIIDDNVAALMATGAGMCVQQTMNGDRWLSELVRAEETKSFLQVSQTGAIATRIVEESGSGKSRNTEPSGK